MSDRLYIICEGQSENAFVRELLIPYCGERSGWKTSIIPYTVITSFRRQKGTVYKGGLTSFLKFKGDLEKCLAYGCPVTTMIDFYGLPNDFPEYEHAMTLSRDIDKVLSLEKSLAKEIELQFTDLRSGFFIPYIQLHEFEALFYSDLSRLKNYYLDREYDQAIDRLNRVTMGMPPEDIDQGYETAPSKRLESAIPYHKGESVVSPLKEIGIDIMRKKCPHFNEWVEKVLNVIAM